MKNISKILQSALSLFSLIFVQLHGAEQDNAKDNQCLTISRLQEFSLRDGNKRIADSIPSVRLNSQWIVFRDSDDEQWKKYGKNGIIPPGRQEIINAENGFIDLCPTMEKELTADRRADLFNVFDSDKDSEIFIGCGCDWKIQICINGQNIYDCFANGNQYPENINNRTLVIPVKKGKNVLSVRLLSGVGGWSFLYREFSRKEYDFIQPIRENFSRCRTAAFGSAERYLYEILIQNAVYELTNTIFYKFDKRDDIPEEELSEFYKKYPVLEFYDKSIDKIIAEIPAEPVPQGGIVIWHLYNMGYVVKTENACFGIDLHHRRAHLLEPLLDFIVTTHNHDDHYNAKLFRQMQKKNKKIISNFYPASGYSRPPKTIQLGDITIESEETDHNGKLKQFMAVYRIICGKDDRDHVVLYTSGDSCDAGQLNPKGPIDVYIVHPRVGLNVLNQVERINPSVIFFSHLNEMGHCKPSIYRPVAFDEPLTDTIKIHNAGFSTCGLSPFWGEKIIIPAPLRKE